MLKRGRCIESVQVRGWLGGLLVGAARKQYPRILNLVVCSRWGVQVEEAPCVGCVRANHSLPPARR